MKNNLQLIIVRLERRIDLTLEVYGKKTSYISKKPILFYILSLDTHNFNIFF